MDLIHSVLIWDCAFRDFFHTVHSLAGQTYASSAFEVIAVEQRSRELSDTRSHSKGLPSLHDTWATFGDRINIQVVYMDEPVTIPYHLGRTLNVGIGHAEGKYISVMDADMLFPPNFLSSLDHFHEAAHNRIANLFRHMADEPVDAGYAEWHDQDFSYDAVLRACPTKDAPIPSHVTNKGPLISAHVDLWNSVRGYDEHPIWSTGVSRLGQDVNKRMEIAGGKESNTLKGCAAVHPWHPMGFRRDTLASTRLLRLQQSLIDWAVKREKANWKNRIAQTRRAYERNRRFVDHMIHSHLGDPGSPEAREERSGTLAQKLILAAGRLSAKVYRKYFELLG